VSQVKSPAVNSDSTVTQNFTLQAGRLTVSPASVAVTVAMGASVTKNVTFRDTGKAPVNVTLYQNPGGFTIQGVPGNGPPIQRVTGTYSPLSAAYAKKIASGTPTAPAQPYAAPWTTVANFPTAIMDNAVATDTATGKVYSAGGYDGSSTTAAAYVYDPATQAWTALPALANPREEPQAAFVSGKLYVFGGWGSDGNPVATTEVYDPSAGTWSTAASDPIPYAGASVATLNGKVYLIGGCDAANCGHADVQVYDPAANSWSTAAAYPTTIAWEGCGAVAAEIYCAGGTTGATSDTANAYAYNAATDSWSAIAPVPIDLWAMGYTAANGQLLLSGGVTSGFSSLTNQGYAYDPGTGTWTALPNSNSTDYRGGSACGFYRIGGSTGGFSPANSAEQLPGYASCGITHVPWLSESATLLTIAPGASATVTVTLNAADPSVTQPGAYTASLSVSDDTPYSTSPIGVTMTATPPKTWGKITGTVSGTACSGTTAPIAGATVQIDTWAASYTLKTGNNGLYALWLDYRNNPLTLIIAKDSWQPQATTVTIKKGAITTASFTLKPDSC